MPIRVRHERDGRWSHYFITVDLGGTNALTRDAVLTALVDVFIVISIVVKFHHMATTGTFTLASLGIQLVSFLILGYSQFVYWKSTFTALLGRRSGGEPTVSPQVARRALRRELSLLAVLLGGVTLFGSLDVADEVRARHIEWLWFWLVAIAVALLLLYALVRAIWMLHALRPPPDGEASGDRPTNTLADDDVHAQGEEYRGEDEGSDN